ncbi:MAG: phage tail length tape measure family protein [Betaproteobacteria bacterium]|nr:phage tail length tape measure family protein [Betaproteobacteria bacterium]
MNEIVLGIRLTADGKAVVTEVRAATEEVKKLGQAAGRSNAQAAAEGEKFTGSLKRQADTLGMTKSQTLAYEASQHQLTTAQKESVAQSIRAIGAHEQHQMVLGRVKVAAAAAGAAVTAMAIGGLKAMITETARAEQANLKLEAVLRATGNAAGFTKAQLDAEAESLKRSTGFDDDQVRASMAVMLTFKQITGDTFSESMRMAADLSRLLGQDLQSSVLQLGKALENPETGLTMLSRSGVSFNDTQKETIKRLVDVGRQAEALTLILQTMKHQGIDRVAESMNVGLTAAMRNAGLAWDDLLKEIGKTPQVRGPVEATFNHIEKVLLKTKDLVEQPWTERLKIIMSGGLYSGAPPARGEYVGGTEGRLAREGAQRQAEEQARAQARAGLASFMTPFQGEEQKMLIAMRDFLARSEGAGLSDDEVQRGIRTIRSKFMGKEEASAAMRAAEELRNLYDQLDNTGTTVNAAFRKQLGMLHGEYEKGGMTLEVYQARVTELINRTGFATKLKEQEKVALDAYLKSEEFHADVMREINELTAQQGKLRAEALRGSQGAADLARDEQQIAERELSLMGASVRERTAVIEQLKAEQQVRRQIEDLKNKGVYLDETDQEHMMQKAREAAAARARTGEIRETQQAWQRTADNIERSLTDALMRGFERGENIAQNFWHSVRNIFLTQALQIPVRFVAGTMASAIGSLGIPGLANAGGGASSLLGMGNLVSGAGALSKLGFGFGQTMADFGNFFGSIGSLTESGATFGLMDAIGGFAAANPVTAALMVAGLALGGSSLLGNKRPSAQLTGRQLSGNVAGYGGLNAAPDLTFNTGFTPASAGWEYMGGLFQTEIRALYDQVAQLGQTLGRDTSGLRGFTASVSTPKFLDYSEILGTTLQQISDQLATQLLPDLQDLAKAGESATQTLVRLANEAQQQRLGEIFGRMGAAVQLQDATRDLWLSDLSPLTARQRLDASNARYSELLGLARGGDIGAYQELQGFVRGNLEENRGYYAGASPEYVATFRQRMEEIQDLTSNTITEQSIQFAELGLTMRSIDTRLANMDQRIEQALERAVGARLDALRATAEAGNDQITDAIVSTPIAVANNAAGASGALFLDDSTIDPTYMTD